MPSMPTSEQIDEQARELGIADENGKARRRDRGRIVEHIWQQQASEKRLSEDAPAATADVIAALCQDLRQTTIPTEAIAAILGAAAHAHTARHGIHLRKETPR